MLAQAPTTEPTSPDIPNGQPELTVFVYDAGGKLIGEYSTNIETAAPKVQYLTADREFQSIRRISGGYY